MAKNRWKWTADTSYSGGAVIWKIARLNGNESAARRVFREPPLGKPRRPAEQFVNTIRRRQQGLTLAHLPRRMPISPYNKGVVNDYRREGYRKSGPQTVCWQNIGILALTERDNRFIKWLISFFHRSFLHEMKLDFETCLTIIDLTFPWLSIYFLLMRC